MAALAVFLAIPALRPRCRPAPMQQIGRGNIEQPKPWKIVLHRVPRLQHFGRDRSGKGNRSLSAGGRRFEPVSARQCIAVPAVIHPFDLLDRAGGQTQID